jgi:DNA polymerase III gamma/tau subunit
MKKNMNILLSSLVIAGLLAGCGAKTTTTSTKSSADSARTEQSTSHKHKTSVKSAASEKKTTEQKNESQSAASQTAASATSASNSVVSAAQASSSANTLKVGTAMVTLPETQSSKAAVSSQTAATPAAETATQTTQTSSSASTQQPATTQNTEQQVAQLSEDQMTDQQKAGLLAWYTSHYVTNEATPQANRPLVVTAMNESSVLAPLPNGTNNTYYQIYGAKPDESEWVNYYAQGKNVDGSPIADTVYIYNNQQWNPYQVSDMVNTANQNSGVDYVNQVANNVQMYDER